MKIIEKHRYAIFNLKFSSGASGISWGVSTSLHFCEGDTALIHQFTHQPF